MTFFQRIASWFRRDQTLDLATGILVRVRNGLNAEPNATERGQWRDPDEVWNSRKEKRATCRHAATVMMYQLVRQGLATESSIEYVEGTHTRVPQGQTRHAWLEWEHGGRTYIVDPYGQEYVWRASSLPRGEYDGVLHLNLTAVRNRIQAAQMSAEYAERHPNDTRS